MNSGLDKSVDFEDSSDEEDFQEKYPLLYLLKYEPNNQVIMNALMNH
jgi:hypothetical protein